MVRMVVGPVGPRVRSWVAAEAAIYIAQNVRQEVIVEPTADTLPSPLMVARPCDHCHQVVIERHTKWCADNGFDPDYIAKPASLPLPCVA